jgi:hypothetical protein
MAFARLRARRQILVVVFAALAFGVFGGRAAAASLTKSYEPVRETPRALIFQVEGMDNAAIVGARAKLRVSRHALRRWLEHRYRDGSPAKRRARHRARRRLHRSLSPRRVRNAADRGGGLRLRKPKFVRGGRLKVELEAWDGPAPACVLDPSTMTAPGCPVVREDTAANPDPKPLWGSIDCADDSRHQWLTGGADPHPTATGAPQGEDAYRSLTVIDGDDVWGERCELGRNDHRYGDYGEGGTFAMYREGERRITFISYRLPPSFPLETTTWQPVLQMKQTQPSANGGGTPILAMRATAGRWALMNSDSPGPSADSHEIWSIPAQSGVWTRFAFDVYYSPDPAQGSIQVYVDLNGDGDATDPEEQSPMLHTSTLKYETEGGNPMDGIAPSQSIASHLRTGIYHDEQIPCPAGCAVEVDNVQVVG